jgi:hypothetical protein
MMKKLMTAISVGVTALGTSVALCPPAAAGPACPYDMNTEAGQSAMGQQTLDLTNRASATHDVKDLDALNDLVYACIDTPDYRKAPPAPVSAPEPVSAGDLDARIDSFVANTNGNQIGDGQCVTLIKRYLSDVYGIDAGGWGDAIDYRSGSSGGNQLLSHGFTWHEDQNFANGDILVWRQDPRFAFLPQGHIATWYNGKIYDQNYVGRLTAGSDPFSGYGYLGYWRKAS